jgi:hypothetical protein
VVREDDAHHKVEATALVVGPPECRLGATQGGRLEAAQVGVAPGTRGCGSMDGKAGRMQVGRLAGRELTSRHGTRGKSPGKLPRRRRAGRAKPP